MEPKEAFWGVGKPLRACWVQEQRRCLFTCIDTCRFYWFLVTFEISFCAVSYRQDWNDVHFTPWGSDAAATYSGDPGSVAPLQANWFCILVIGSLAGDTERLDCFFTPFDTSMQTSDNTFCRNPFYEQLKSFSLIQHRWNDFSAFCIIAVRLHRSSCKYLNYCSDM